MSIANNATCHPEKPAGPRGLCSTCYGRAWRAGLIETEKREVTCHPGREHHAKGLCADCYETSRGGHGKINKPGPDSPGGPRVERKCEVCGDSFWPRVVDVERGKGRHCSSSCSSKVFRRPVKGVCALCPLQVEGLGKAPKHCSDCKARLKETKRLERANLRLEEVEARRSALATIEIGGQMFTPGEVAEATGVSKKTLRDRVLNGRNVTAVKGDYRRPGSPFGPKGKPVAFKGETMSIRKWASRFGVSSTAISKRLKRDGTEKALTYFTEKAAHV